MKSKVTCLLITLSIFSFSVLAQGKASPEAEAFFTKAMSQINPKHAAWVRSTAKKVNAKKMSESAVRAEASKYANSFANADVDALVVLVMMQASKEAYKDIKDMMEQMEANRKRKDSIRAALQLLAKREAENKEMPRYEYDSIAKLKTKATVKPIQRQLNQQAVITNNKTGVIAKASKAEMEQLKKELTDKRDSISEMGEQDRLQLQMMMERKNQLESIISNTMKKISDTQSGIIQNLKAS